MVDLVELAKMIEALTDEERNVLNILLRNNNEEEQSIEALLDGLRFLDKRVCPFCGGTHIAKNGKRKDGTQKYICRDCGRNPLATSNSLLSDTHNTQVCTSNARLLLPLCVRAKCGAGTV